jgi:YegS/Rv2252/BmrU family lipid kinase
MNGNLQFEQENNLNRICLIVNPASNREAAQKALPTIKTVLDELDIEYDIKFTQYFGHGIHLAEEACSGDYETLVAVGGDGTVNEVINGMMGADKDTPGFPNLAVLPVGRGNDFSYGMGIPQDLESACKLLAEGKPRPIDIGLSKGGDYPEGRYFGNGIGVGFDAMVVFESAKLPPWIRGMAGYTITALKTIFLYFNAPTLQLDIDGEVLEQPCLLVSLMNGRRMGGSFMFAPDSKPDDGLLNLCIASQASRLQVLGLFPKVMSGTQASHPVITMLSGRSIKIKALEGTLPVHADGEKICEAGHALEVEVVDRALKLICP